MQGQKRPSETDKSGAIEAGVDYNLSPTRDIVPFMSISSDRDGVALMLRLTGGYSW